MSKLPIARVVRDSGGGETKDPEGASNGVVLRLAPRPLPRALVWRLLFGGHFTVGGWLFAALGMAFVCAGLPETDVNFASYERYADAKVTRIELASAATKKSTASYRVHYTFHDDAGVEHHGASYTARPPIGEDTWLVEYRGGDPSHSRLSGMNSDRYPPVFLLALLLPLVGFGIAVWQLPDARRNLRILRHGLETRGKLVEKREASLQYRTSGSMTKESMLYELIFQYEVQGITYATTVETDTSRVLEDDEREPMLYDPWAPKYATPLDHLPGSPKLTASGDLEARPGIAIHLLMAPVACVVLLVATVVRMIIA